MLYLASIGWRHHLCGREPSIEAAITRAALDASREMFGINVRVAESVDCCHMADIDGEPAIHHIGLHPTNTR
eukprot:5015155-Prorocentrum_lima.AAC.1